MRTKKTTILFISILFMVVPLMRISMLRASMSFTADDTYLYGAVTVYFPDGAVSMEMSGPDGTFNKGNAGSAYIESDGKATINYGYMKEGSTFTLRVFDADGAEVNSDFTFFIKAKNGSSGTFLVAPPEEAPTPTPIPSPTPTPTPIPEATPTPIPPIVVNTPTPSPEPTSTPTPAAESTPTPTNTPTPSPTPTPEPTPTETPTPSPEPTSTPSPVPTESPTPSPEPTDTPTPVPETEPTEEPTMPEPSETEPPEPTVKNYEVKKAIANIIPGVYIENPHEEMRISWDAFISATLILFLLGFLIMFLFKVHEGNKKILERRYFKGIEIENKEPEDSKGEDNK